MSPLIFIFISSRDLPSKPEAPKFPSGDREKPHSKNGVFFYLSGLLHALMKKTIFLFTAVTLFSLSTYAQKKFNVEIISQKIVSSLVYKISSDEPADFKINILSYDEKKQHVEKIHKSLLGEHYFKLDISKFTKGKYKFIATSGDKKHETEIIKY